MCKQFTFVGKTMIQTLYKNEKINYIFLLPYRNTVYSCLNLNNVYFNAIHLSVVSYVRIVIIWANGHKM